MAIAVALLLLIGWAVMAFGIPDTAEHDRSALRDWRAPLALVGFVGFAWIRVKLRRAARRLPDKIRKWNDECDANAEIARKESGLDGDGE